MPTLVLRAINPQRRSMTSQLPQVDVRVKTALRDFGVAMVAAMAKYPPQQPTPYRRTGALGRGWQIKIRRSQGGRGIVSEEAAVEVFNAVTSGGTRRRGRRGRRRGGRTASRPYAVYVQGPDKGPGPGTRQTAVMRRKGWQNITTESQRVFKRYRGQFRKAIILQ